MCFVSCIVVCVRARDQFAGSTQTKGSPGYIIVSVSTPQMNKASLFLSPPNLHRPPRPPLPFSSTLTALQWPTGLIRHPVTEEVMLPPSRGNGPTEEINLLFYPFIYCQGTIKLVLLHHSCVASISRDVINYWISGLKHLVN